jgi:hypothetical protein
LFGTTFPRDPVAGGVFAFLNPLNSAGIVVREVVGLAVLVWLFASHGMLSREGVRGFLRTGMLEVSKEPT